MFTPVCHSVHRGSLVRGVPGPGGVNGPGGVPGPEGGTWWRYPPVFHSVHGGGHAWSGGGGAPGWVPGPGRVPGGDTPLPTATAAGGTHPTGMHSCFKYILLHVYVHLNTKSSNVELNDEERNAINTVLPTEYRPPTKLREGNVFSRVYQSFYSGGGESHVTNTHNALDLTVQQAPNCPPHTETHLAPTPLVHGPSATGGQHWIPVQTCSLADAWC